MNPADPDQLRHQLEQVLASGALGKSETSRKLLIYLFDRALKGDTPKELELAIDVFGRDARFHGAEDSLVRVGVRTLRQKLTEYYAGPGRHDPVHFVIPKGGYRLTTQPGDPIGDPPSPAEPAPTANASHPAGRKPQFPSLFPFLSRAASERPLRLAAAMAIVTIVLIASLAANLYFLKRPSELIDPSAIRVRESPIWSDINASPRPLMIVLGDLFMYTQTDPQTGRTLTVRDSGINTSEELRAFLASNPSLAADRGQRYTTLIPKSAAVGMAAILPVVGRPGRRVEVRILDELQPDDIRDNDIIFIGPFVRLGPLAGHYQIRSRYRYDAQTLGLTDKISQQAFLPEGALANQRTDYGLAAKFVGPSGNHIVILTSVGRNAGLLQIVRTLTSPEGLAQFEAKLRTKASGTPESFEALLAVSGFKRTDVAAELVDIHPLSMEPGARHTAAQAAPQPDNP
jgi:hypothetical protein